MTRDEKIAFIRGSNTNIQWKELNTCSDDELDIMVREIVLTMNNRYMGVQMLKNILIFLN